MKIVIITSGGMDSTVLLHKLVCEGNDVRALGIIYGQRHQIELGCARYQAQKVLNIPFQVADLGSLQELLPGSSQTDLSIPVPEGHYAEENMKKTVVPNRNMILLSVAIGVAAANKYHAVAYGAHAGDHAIYPDCRPEFADAMDRAAALCDWNPVKLIRPLIHMTKGQIAKLGYELGVDFTKTYSCYKGGPIHCGRCGACVERIGAFHEAGVADPTEYLDREFALKFIAK